MIRRIHLTTLLIVFSLHGFAQNISGPELLRKSISYHDPNNMWPELKATMELEQSRPNGNSRTSVLHLDNGTGYFQITDQIDGHTIVKTVENNSGQVTFDGSYDIDDAYKAKYRLSNEGVLRTRNYNVYLYGLPMKLTDPGTNIADEVSMVSFDGKDYLELKVTYDEGVGSDDWFFYMNPSTYAMEGYKFYHQNGKGEYITLEGEASYEGLRIPQLRKWYTTNDSTYLGADNVLSIKTMER